MKTVARSALRLPEARSSYAKRDRSVRSIDKCVVLGSILRPSFPGDEIDERRHAVMAGAFADDAVVLLDLHQGEVAERLFQHGAGIEVLDLAGSAGAVIELLGTVALHEEPPAGLQRLLDPVKDFRPQGG